MTNATIKRQQVAEDHRIDHIAKLFDGYWDFYALPNDRHAITEEDSRVIAEDCVEDYDTSVGSNLEAIRGAGY